MVAIKKADRARQFMPFSALTGYMEILREREKIVQPQRELSDEEAEMLSDKLSRVKKGAVITVTYYHEDCYKKLTGIVSEIDSVCRNLTVVKTKIPFDDVSDIKIKSEDIAFE